LQFGVRLISTGGTAQLLRESGVNVTDIAEHTGFAEMLDGRVKTLHPKIHGGILARRDMPAHVSALAATGIAPIDLVVVNLYPFGATVARPDCSFEQAIENIDIGGPAMVRSGGKEQSLVAVITDVRDYAPVLKEMRAANGAIGAATSLQARAESLLHTAA
jgi:phosphoribosylaminoimidazolecarboxamide formyltransferase/IMP cyclohydrolase